MIPKTGFPGKATLVSGASPFDTAPPASTTGGATTGGVTTGRGGGNQGGGMFGPTGGAASGGGGSNVAGFGAAGEEKTPLPLPSSTLAPRAPGQGLGPVPTKTTAMVVPKAAADLFGGPSSSSQVTELPVYLHTYLLTYLPTYLLIYLPNFVPIYLFTYLPTFFISYLPTYYSFPNKP